MDRDKQPVPPKSPASQNSEELSRNSDVEEFFRKLKSDLKRPKPGDDSIAAALQAIQRLAHEVDPQQIAEDSTAPLETSIPAGTCLICGVQNREDNVFCGKCGAPLIKPMAEDAPALSSSPGPTATPEPSPSVNPAPGQHHYHHHYHHHYFPAGSEVESQAPGFGPRSTSASNKDAARVRAPLTGPAQSRAESAVRKLTQEWALACNTKQLEDLVDFYAPDAILMRSNVPPVRGVAAIREFFFAALDAGFGEVEMEPLRVELFGDIAFEAGRCKMLVPIVVGKRREERGKYLVIFTRQATGDWKAVADCWSSDLSLPSSAEAEVPKPGGALSTANPLSRTPRRTA